MPIITAFQGTITVEGRSQGSEKPFYTWTLSAYGATIGELLDNLVTISVTVANDVFAWVTKNKPADYDMEDDYWYVQMTHPDILETAKNDPKTHSSENDIGSGSSLSSVNGIVRFSTLIRDIQVSSSTSYLLLADPAPSDIENVAAEAAVPYKGIYEVTSFSEMTKFGFSGKELDVILEIAEREGRVKKYREEIAQYRGHARKSARSEASSAPKKHWWKKLVA